MHLSNCRLRGVKNGKRHINLTLFQRLEQLRTSPFLQSQGNTWVLTVKAAYQLRDMERAHNWQRPNAHTPAPVGCVILHALRQRLHVVEYSLGMADKHLTRLCQMHPFPYPGK